MLPLTNEQQEEYDAATICHICEDVNKPFNSENIADSKIRDHCHLTGIFLNIYIYLNL